VKKKFLIITTILFVVFGVIATVFFFLMKSAESGNTDSSSDANETEQVETYDAGPLAEKLEFLKLNTYDEVKAYAEENPVYIQTSNDPTVFTVGELYIGESPVTLLYQLNEDGTINRIDGYCSLSLDVGSASGVGNTIEHLNTLIAAYFDVDQFGHDAFNKEGAPLNCFGEQLYEEMFNNGATYGLSVIDESSTYWNVSAVVVEQKHLDIEFFRCFDLSVYDDTTPNIDLRVTEQENEEIEGESEEMTEVETGKETV